MLDDFKDVRRELELHNGTKTEYFDPDTTLKELILFLKKKKADEIRALFIDGEEVVLKYH